MFIRMNNSRHYRF